MENFVLSNLNPHQQRFYFRLKQGMQVFRLTGVSCRLSDPKRKVKGTSVKLATFERFLNAGWLRLVDQGDYHKAYVLADGVEAC